MLEAQYEAAVDGILMVDADGGIVSYNQRFIELWEIPPGVLVSRSDERALAYVLDKLADSAGFLKRVRELYENRWEKGFDEIELKDGRTIDRYTTPVFGPGKRYLGRVWYFRDVTDRRRAEDSQRSTEARYRELFEAGSDAVIMIDLSTQRIEDANRAALSLFGYTKAELLAMKVDRLYVEPELAIKTLRGLDADGNPAAMPLRRTLARKDGSHFSAEIAAGRYYHGRAHKAIAALRDTSDRERAAQAEFFREREQLQRQFVATVSHELRTPISAIQGFAETLLGGALDDKSTRRDFVRTIHRHSHRLAKLVDDLLMLSVFESGRRSLNLESIEASRFVDDFVAGMAPLAKRRGARLVAEISPKLRLHADSARLTQVLQNLVDNAIKFGKPKRTTVRITAEGAGGHARFAVSDDGPGIPEPQLERVFEPFHRLEASRHPGAGLGLAIVRQVVLAHGGRVWAESKPGQGTCFRFTLPLKPATNPKRLPATVSPR